MKTRSSNVNPDSSHMKLYLIGLIGLQGACASFFVFDVVQDFMAGGSGAGVYLVMELLAVLSLAAAAVLELKLLRGLLRRNSKAERSLLVARGQMQDVVDAYFRDWGLTAAEADVASMTIKGFSISEISQMRQAREGTVKTQLTAIYRKAGVAGRSQLGSLLIEDLMGTPLSQ
jgi:DNA-binding CsgD family transcriptional regulator